MRERDKRKKLNSTFYFIIYLFWTQRQLNPVSQLKINIEGDPDPQYYGLSIN
jgi:hypothetical protein